MKMLFLSFAFIMLQACDDAHSTTSPDRTTTILNDTATVTYFKLDRKKFHKELICNGRLAARRKAVLSFRQTGLIVSVNLHNGMRVKQGEVIASLDRNRLSNALEARRIRLAQARLDYEDRLLTMGYNVKDSSKLPFSINQAALIRSGYKQSIIELSEANLDYEQAEIKAPFSGIIAGLNMQPFNMSDTYKNGCTFIDDSEFLIDFNIIESELAFIRQSKEVTVIPFNDPLLILQGKVVAVNPVVDDAGMINITATVMNKAGKLLDGMNVRIFARQEIENQLVIPKAAILERQGRKVVFTYEDGYALWHYVEIGAENSEFCTVTSGLKENDNVIFKGNFNLAHNKPVKATESR